MISQNTLLCQPKLKPCTFSPSEDDPKEFILIDSENGAALGITHEEKRLIELFNGKNGMAEIIERVIHERIAPLSTLRRLLWDLYRFGLLESSPWEIENTEEGWGYWGKPNHGMSPFWIHEILGPLEILLGRLMISPFFHVAVFFAFACAAGMQWTRFHEVKPFIVGGSVAAGLLVVLCSLMGGTLIALWFGAMVLRAVHSSPVRCVADYRYALPIFRLDGRRLRAYPTRKAFHCAMSPLIGLLLVSSLFLLAAGFSEDARMEGLIHISVTLWMTLFLLAIPWNSTLFSRDILLRLREESIFTLMMHAVRRAVHFLFQSRLTGEAHAWLFLAWGVWSILGSLILVRLAAFLLRWEIPILVRHFMTEENRLVLITLFSLLGVFAAALIATMGSFLIWLCRETVREIRHRYWPERDRAIAALGIAAAFFFTAQYFWTLPFETAVFNLIPTVMCGLILIVSSLLFWKNSGYGLEPLIHVFPLINGCLFLLFSLSTLCTTKTGSLPVVCLWFCHIILAGWIVYWIAMYGFLFAPTHSMSKNPGTKIIQSGIVLLAGMGFIQCISFPPGLAGTTGAVLFPVVYVMMSLSSIWMGWLLNYSAALLGAGSLIACMGLVQIPAESYLISGPLLMVLGTIVSVGGLFLRASAMSKVSLNVHPMTPAQPARVSWTLESVSRQCGPVITAMYNATLKQSLPGDINDDSLRAYFSRMKKYTGNMALHAMMRGVSRFAPWYAFKDFVKLLPASVSAPRLSDWTADRIEPWLRKVPTFSNLPKNEMSALISRTHLMIYKPGERIIHQGQREGSMFVIVQGDVSVELERPFGNRILTVLEKGSFIGEIGFLCAAERTATVRSLTASILLCLDREDIDENLPAVQTALKEAEAGDSWIKSFCQTSVFSEFPPSLSARICLESKHVSLERGDSLWLEKEDLSENVAVFLQGKGTMIKEGGMKPLTEGSLVGLEASLAGNRMQGTIRAETSSRILLVDRALFREALAELLTPAMIFESSHEISDA